MKRIGMLVYMVLAALDHKYDLARLDWWCNLMHYLAFMWPAYDGEDNLTDWWHARFE